MQRLQKVVGDEVGGHRLELVLAAFARLPLELIIVLVDETVTFRSVRFAEKVISMKLLLVSVDLWANGFGFTRSGIAA